MKKIFSMYAFLRDDLWRIRRGDTTPLRYRLLNYIRVMVLSARGLSEDRLQLRASALTFYSLLSVVPVVGMIFGVAKGFGFQKTLENELMQKLEGHEEVVVRIIDFSKSLLENTKGGLIAGVGLVILFWTVIKVLSNIENSFNDIWGVPKARSFARKISDYLSLMLIGPILFIMSSSMTVLITGQAEMIIKEIDLLGPIAPLIMFLLRFLPYCVLWLLFSFVYIFMPNTKVRFSSGILAGVLAGTMFQVFQWAYITFQIGMAKYNAVYGSFAALPLFLFWLQISWLIVLLGAEISFAHQNVDTYEFEEECRSLSEKFRKLLALSITHLLVKDFMEGGEPWTETRISKRLEIPIRCVRQTVGDLVDAGVISEIRTSDEKEVAIQPAISTEAITIKFVLDALSNRGFDDIPISGGEQIEKISGYLEEMGSILEGSSANVLLKEI